MRSTILAAAALSVAALSVAAVPAAAQFKLPAGLGGGLPAIGSAGVGNVAGLLGYCVKNRLTGVAGGQTAQGAQGVLGRLTAQPGVTATPGYQQGLLGRVLGGTAPAAAASPSATATGAAPAAPAAVSLDGLNGTLKARACDLVLKRAGSFL